MSSTGDLHDPSMPGGSHTIVELHGCDAAALDDPDRIESLLAEAARRAGTTVIGTLVRTFDPTGVTGVVVISESHLSIHTWPEHGYAAVDFFTCGNGSPAVAIDTLARGLQAERLEQVTVIRGKGLHVLSAVPE